MSAISKLTNMLVFHIIFRNRQILSGKLSLSNYIRNLCHQLWQKFTPDEKLQQMVAEFLLHCNSLTIGARNMHYHLRLIKDAPHPHFGTVHRKVRKERKAQPQCGTRMTRIGRIFTDPCASASSVQSVFHHVCSSLKNTASGASVSAFICVHPRFFKNRQTLSAKLVLSNYIRYFCHQLWQKFTPDENLSKEYGGGFNERNRRHIINLFMNVPKVNALRSELLFSVIYSGSSHRKVRKERKAHPQYGTRMTRIGRIITDTANPRASAQSAFHHVCSSLKNTASGASVSAFICVHPRLINLRGQLQAPEQFAKLLVGVEL